MSPQDALYWQRARRRAARLEPDLAAALLRAFQIIRESLSESELARLIDAGQIDQVLADIASSDTLDRAFLKVRSRLRTATETSYTAAIKELPKGGKVDGVLAVSFDYLNPRVIDAVQQLDTKVIQTWQDSIRETVKQHISNGLTNGQGPRVIAKGLRDVIGMSPTQAMNAAKYEQGLREKGGTEDQIAKQVATYKRRAASLNAETNARTAALDAMKLGQQLSWQDAVEKGVINGPLTKRWVGVKDDRERLSHLAMEGETVPYDEPYSNGQMIPGDTEYNCRCISRYAVAR